MGDRVAEVKSLNFRSGNARVGFSNALPQSAHLEYPGRNLRNPKEGPATTVAGFSVKINQCNQNFSFTAEPGQ